MNRIIILIVGLTVLFTILFYHTGIALNLLIFNMVILLLYWNLGYFNFSRSLNSITVLAGTILTSIFVVLNHTKMSVFMNIVSLFLLAGTMCYPKSRSLVNSIKFSFINVFSSQKIFYKKLNQSENKIRLGLILKWIKIVFIPILIIILFVILYKASNPIFSKHFTIVFQYISKKLGSIFSFSLFFVFLGGLIVSTFLLIKNSSKEVIESDINSSDFLSRKKEKKSKQFKFNALSVELKSALFLLIVLNLLILAENMIDIYWVWFNFEWSGDYLKQFVHEGTYLLILSIIISIGLTLYFFRGNLNFYRKNKLLKILSYSWLFQNAILTISVAFRNYRYIETFALAYKRIGVYFFLTLVLFGLVTVIYKIRNCKSSFFLFRINTLALYVVLLLFSFLNWDVIIARYNFKNYEKSFLHLNFLANLSNAALPYVLKDIEELRHIDEVQKKKFNFNEVFMSPDDYYFLTQKKKNIFIEEWESKKVLEWNYSDWRAYKELTR